MSSPFPLPWYNRMLNDNPGRTELIQKLAGMFNGGMGQGAAVQANQGMNMAQPPAMAQQQPNWQAYSTQQPNANSGMAWSGNGGWSSNQGVSNAPNTGMAGGSNSGWSSNAGQSATQGSGVAAAPTDYRALEEERKAKQAQRANWAAR